jgi:very-short-patch-repair endonuclease
MAMETTRRRMSRAHQENVAAGDHNFQDPDFIVASLRKRALKAERQEKFDSTWEEQLYVTALAADFKLKVKKAFDRYAVDFAHIPSKLAIDLRGGTERWRGPNSVCYAERHARAVIAAGWRYAAVWSVDREPNFPAIVEALKAASELDARITVVYHDGQSCVADGVDAIISLVMPEGR